ncbi:hypothetical protein [Nocardioides sp. LHG3406-4]|uniref:hypothetical protein n=1 Tax=Nocardioides sp. LHG3406-4 TaxID=2804575 RepID=UPI003CFB9DFA
MRSPIHGRVAAATVAVICLSMMTACSDDEPRAQSAPTTPASSTTTVAEPAVAPPLTTQAEVKKVVGKLESGGRGQLVRQITPVVDTWWEAAYLGGTWPRTAFRDAFPGFTQGATKEARRDKDLLSNADIGADVTAVTATKRDVRLDVIAPSGRIAGVTARIALDYDTTGEQPHQVTVRGRVFLTRKEGTWRIFGYDVRKAVK